MKQSIRKKTAAAGIFAAILLIMIVLLSAVFTPTYYDWSQDNSSKGVYRTPRNTLQVTFVGTSQVGLGISPMELYVKHGICANQVAGGSQPMIASYFWLREIYGRNRKSLQTVVVDASGLFLDSEDRNIVAGAEKSLSGMRLSANKIRSFMELEEKYPEVSALDNLIPLFRYHSRWTSLVRDDFTGITDGRNYFYTMGYTPYYLRSRNVISQEEIDVPNYSLTDALDTDEEARRATLDPDGEEALDKIADFCAENGLQLVLIKLPKEWEDVQHDALTQKAAELDVPLLDMNMPDALEKMGMDFPEDYVDVRHPNINGAVKMTDYIADYLAEHYEYEDKRGDRHYAFMDEYAAQYEELLMDAQLQKCDDLTAYLDQLTEEKDRYRIYIAVRGDGAGQMPESARQYFDGLGLTELAQLRENTPYVGVVDGGNVLADKMAEEGAEAVMAYGAVRDTEAEILELTDLWDPAEVEAAAEKQPQNRFRLTSGHLDGNTVARINVAEKKYSPNKEGLNIVVYNRRLGIIVDAASFDTHSDCARTSGTKDMSTYEMRILQSKLTAASSPEEYLSIAETLPDPENYVTMICVNPVQDNAQEDKEGTSRSEEAGAGQNTEAGSFTVLAGGKTIREETVHPGIRIGAEPGQVNLLQYSYSVGEDGKAVLTIGNTTYQVAAGSTLAVTFDSIHGWVTAKQTFSEE